MKKSQVKKQDSNIPSVKVKGLTAAKNILTELKKWNKMDLYFLQPLNKIIHLPEMRKYCRY